MKLEMGESLVFSWLKHEKQCKLVQMNWKASKEWNTFIPDKDLNGLFNDAKRFFKLDEIEFVSKKVKNSEQLIKQGEIDVIGIEFGDEPLCVKNIHAVDVAFHEAGLNYGSEKETEARIIKKYIRTALSIYKYFGVKEEADIYFVTPNTGKKYIKTYIDAKSSVKHFFEERGFKFSFHLYSNEDFYSAIFLPVKRISEIEKDTSELFSRALTLTRLMDKESEKDVILSETDAQNSPYLEERKIGQIVREVFDVFSEKQILTKDVIEDLLDNDFSKSTFGLSISVMVDNEEKRFDAKGYSRYYASPYKLNGKDYYLCSQWLDKHKEGFIKWYHSIKQ